MIGLVVSIDGLLQVGGEGAVAALEAAQVEVQHLDMHLQPAHRLLLHSAGLARHGVDVQRRLLDLGWFRILLLLILLRTVLWRGGGGVRTHSGGRGPGRTGLVGVD